MEYLSAEQFSRSVEAVDREVDNGLLRVRYGCGSATHLLASLAAYQNPDGGFGHGLEPDFHLPDSSPMATTVALQYLLEAEVPAESPLLRRAIDFLVDTFDPGIPGWEPVPPAVDDHPRAPWWAYRPPQGFAANPGAEIVGAFLRYPGLVPGDVLDASVAAAERTLDGLGPDIEPHEVLCWLRLAEAAPTDLRDRVLARIRAAVPSVVVTDPARWDEYVPGPLWVAPEPDGPLADLVDEHVDAHLDHLVASRREDGTWAPTWDWGTGDEHWEAAAGAWRSVLTTRALHTLVLYGRLEGF